MDERRQFERVRIPEYAKLYVTDENGVRVGALQMLGRGGMLIASGKQLKLGDIARLVIIDEAERIRCHVEGTVRYNSDANIGVEFQNLQADSAVEIGVIIGKYYAAAATQQ